LAFTNNYSSRDIWWFNSFNPRFSSGPIYLYNFL